MFLLPGKTLGTQVSCTNHNKCQNTWLWLMCHGVWNFSTTIHTGGCSSATSYQLPHAHWTDVITHLNMKTQDTQPYTGAVNMALVCCTDKINIFLWGQKSLWTEWTELNELNWGTSPSAMRWTEWTGNWPDQAGNLNWTNLFRWFWTEVMSFWHYSTPWTSKQAQPAKHTIPPFRQWTLGWWVVFSPGGT